MTRVVKKMLKLLGYELRRIAPSTRVVNGYSLVEYRQRDGTFDYERYRRVQQEGNLKKLDKIWVIEGNIRYLADYLSKSITPIQFGICHGTRRGKEQLWFRQYLSCEVIGTEISESAQQFPHSVQWDFHQANPEWSGKADFIYSNAFDHSYAPEACLNTWMDTLRPGGLCILEHSNLHGLESTSELDPFGAELEIMPYLITRWGQGRYFVREILKAPEKHPSHKHLHFIIIERRH